MSKGIGDAAQFLIPGGAEEKAASMLPAAARGIGKVGLSALSSGLVNKAQGGSFGTGAAAGGIGAGIGQGLKAVAPIIAETGLGLPKAARAFGKTPGKALLEETSGIRPETVAASAQERLGQLNPELERAADAASLRPNSPRGLLTSGTQEISLHNAPDVRGRLSKPIVLQGNRAMPREFQSYGVNAPVSPRYTEGIPGEGNEIPPRAQIAIQNDLMDLRPMNIKGRFLAPGAVLASRKVFYCALRPLLAVLCRRCCLIVRRRSVLRAALSAAP